MSCLQSNAFLANIFYFCITGLSSDNKPFSNSTTNWNTSQSNCKTQNSMENHATDMCEPNKDTVKTGIWTNIFRVEISAHVDYGNKFYNNKRIYVFILQSLHLICKYTRQIIFCFFSSGIHFKARPLQNYFLCSLLSGVGGTQNQCQ